MLAADRFSNLRQCGVHRGRPGLREAKVNKPILVAYDHRTFGVSTAVSGEGPHRST